MQVHGPHISGNSAFENEKTGDPGKDRPPAYVTDFDQIVGFQSDGISR
jgi:hypothetical protein